ncbi:hypothetical protein Tco_1508378 [Tanacetum coccineum]
MDDPNITMEEYIKVEEEKACRHGKVYNWETATYDRIWYDDDVHDLRSVETKFPTIVFNDTLTSEVALSCEPTVFDFGGLATEMAEGLSGRMLMEHRDAQGQTPSYTAIRDLMLRLCHRLIACSIAGRSQEPEKVTVTDLFYLKGIDIDSVNIPYLLARYLRRFASRRKRNGLTVIVRDLPVIDMAELVRLQICEELVDTWAWVAPGTKRQLDVAAGALEVAEGGPNVDEGAQAVPAPV